jgi:hypothetical protein
VARPSEHDERGPPGRIPLGGEVAPATDAQAGRRIDRRHVAARRVDADDHLVVTEAPVSARAQEADHDRPAALELVLQGRAVGADREGREPARARQIAQRAQLAAATGAAQQRDARRVAEAERHAPVARHHRDRGRPAVARALLPDRRDRTDADPAALRRDGVQLRGLCRGRKPEAAGERHQRERAPSGEPRRGAHQRRTTRRMTPRMTAVVEPMITKVAPPSKFAVRGCERSAAA